MYIYIYVYMYINLKGYLHNLIYIYILLFGVISSSLMKLQHLKEIEQSKTKGTHGQSSKP